MNEKQCPAVESYSTLQETKIPFGFHKKRVGVDRIVVMTHPAQAAEPVKSEFDRRKSRGRGNSEI